MFEALARAVANSMQQVAAPQYRSPIVSNAKSRATKKAPPKPKGAAKPPAPKRGAVAKTQAAFMQDMARRNPWDAAMYDLQRSYEAIRRPDFRSLVGVQRDVPPYGNPWMPNV